MSVKFYPIWFIALELIFTFGISSLVVFQVLTRFTNVQVKWRQHLFIFSLGLGPLTIAWILTMLLLIIPGLPSWFYLVSINCLFVILLIIFYRQLSNVPSMIKSAASAFIYDLKQSKLCLLLYLLSAFFIISLFILSVIVPYAENDALQYAMLAKIMFSHSSARMYPIIHGAHYGGFIAPFTHPLAYVANYIWCYLIQGSATHFGLIRVIAPIYALYTFILCIYVVRPLGNIKAALAGLLFITTPAFAYGVVLHQIEAIRLYSFFLFFMSLPLLRLNNSWRTLVMVGFFLGLCLFCHSISILAIPIFAFIYFFFFAENIVTKLKKIIIVILVALLFVIIRYMINFHMFGSLIHDGTKTVALHALHHHRVEELLDHLTTVQQKWVNGFLRFFYKFSLFGLSYIALFLYLLFVTKNLIKKIIVERVVINSYSEGVLPICLLVTACFFGMIILSILVGNISFIESPRYMISIQPFIAVLAAWVIIAVIDKFFIKIRKVLIPAVVLIVAVLSLHFTWPRIRLCIMQYKISLDSYKQTDFQKGGYVSSYYYLINYFNKHSLDQDKNHRVLVFREGGAAFYLNSHFIYKADPLMMPVYEAHSALKAYHLLLDRKVSYVMVPSYVDDFVTSSSIQTVINNPAMSQLVYVNRGAKIYKLYPTLQKYRLENLGLKNGDFIKNGIIYWSTNTDSILFNPKQGVSIYNHNSSPLNVYFGREDLTYESRQKMLKQPLQPHVTYLYRATLCGHGKLNVYLRSYQGKHQRVVDSPVWNTLLLGERLKTYNIQFVVPTKLKAPRLVLTLKGNDSWITIKNMRFYKIIRDKNFN